VTVLRSSRARSPPRSEHLPTGALANHLPEADAQIRFCERLHAAERMHVLCVLLHNGVNHIIGSDNAEHLPISVRHRDGKKVAPGDEATPMGGAKLSSSDACRILDLQGRLARPWLIDPLAAAVGAERHRHAFRAIWDRGRACSAVRVGKNRKSHSLICTKSSKLP
jgi:hypothetical protein